MLKQLTLENWKSFRHAVLPIDPLTILIGTNASGKSNALEALEFLKRTVLGKGFEAALAGDITLPPIRGSVEWATLKPEPYFRLQVLVQGENETTDYLYNLMLRTVNIVELWSESIVKIKRKNNHESQDELVLFITEEIPGNNPGIFVEIYHPEHPEKKGKIYQQFRRSKSILSQVKAVALAEEIVQGIRLVSEALENIFIVDPIPTKMRGYSPISDRLESDASNIAGVLAALPEEQKLKIENILSTYVKDLPEKDIHKVWAETVGRFNSDAMLYCEELWAKNQPPMLIDARGMSDGTLRFLAILTALLVLPEGSQLVIEDVDNGLHPSRSELLVKMLREIGEQRQIDILATTHNPALLDALGAEIVPFVVVAHRDSETGESELTLLENVENFSKLFASASLGKLTVNGAIERNLSRKN
ncbi:MAG: AAA family ATPase [Phormidium sp.]